MAAFESYPESMIESSGVFTPFTLMERGFVSHELFPLSQPFSCVRVGAQVIPALHRKEEQKEVRVAEESWSKRNAIHGSDCRRLYGRPIREKEAFAMNQTPKVSRRTFARTIFAGFAGTAAAMSRTSWTASPEFHPIRLGGPVMEKFDSPDGWTKAVKALGYSAAYCPAGAKDSPEIIRMYTQAAERANIVIAEVGAWSNPLDPDREKSQEAIKHCQTQLSLADEIGARCCVNISGSVGAKWDGPDAKNLTRETFDKIVEVTRAIIDEVQPLRTYFTLETMPWAYPDSPDSYLELIHAIDRKRFAAHLDPVNLVCSPQRYYGNGALIRECFEKLGPYIKSCHAKDIILREQLTTHLDEIRPGLGGLDYATFLKEVSRLVDVPVMLEHLRTAVEYQEAATYVRKVAKENSLTFAG